MANPIINTARLVLQPWTLSDTAALARLTQDEGFVEFGTLSPMDTDQAQAFLEGRLALCQSGFGIWAIWQDDQIIGNVQVLKQTLDDSQESLPELGYRLQKSSWGQGFATESATALRDYATNVLQCSPLHAFIDLNNHRSQSVARKLGFAEGPTARFKGADIRVWSYSLAV